MEKNKINIRSLERVVTWSWRHIGVKGLCHGHGTYQLKVYKNNYFQVFLSKRERFWPWIESLNVVSLMHLIIDLMKNIIM